MESLNTEKGQTTVEYILLIVVVVSVMTSMFGKLEEFIVSNPNSMQNRYLNQFKEVFQQSAPDPNSLCKAYCAFKIPQ